MLYEIPHLRQSNRNRSKRWFSSRDMDLFVWSHKSMPVRFQLAYDKRNKEKVISWDFYRGFNHYLVDTGEAFPDKYKQAPILTDLRDQQNLTATAREFLAACKNIDAGLSGFIYARLIEHPAITKKHDAGHRDHPLV